MHILIAPNAFKHSLNAQQAATAIAEGLLTSRLDCTCECFPIADGGDGTAELIIERCKGTQVEGWVHDPLGREILASFGLIDDGRTAVIEMANASGIRLLKPHELNPLMATSYGTGEQIKLALDKDVERIIIALGGSATVDGACGMLQALGLRFMDSRGEELKDLPEALTDLAAVDDSDFDKRILKTEVIVLCDVANRLLGEHGAAAVFGPQKGASAAGVRKLDEALAKLAAVGLKKTGKDMSTVLSGGTAGGAAAGLFAFVGAKLVNGIDHFLELTGFDEALEKADLVITGEGSIDEQTLQGKGPFGVARQAKMKLLPVIGLAGKVPSENNEKLQEYFDAIFAIGNEVLDLPAALAATAVNLRRIGTELGNLLAFSTKQL